MTVGIWRIWHAAVVVPNKGSVVAVRNCKDKASTSRPARAVTNSLSSVREALGEIV